MLEFAAPHGQIKGPGQHLIPVKPHPASVPRRMRG
jgi:hypothetical protein